MAKEKGISEDDYVLRLGSSKNEHLLLRKLEHTKGTFQTQSYFGILTLTAASQVKIFYVVSKQ